MQNKSYKDLAICWADTNLQREQITPSEKAYAYKMKYDAIKRKQAERIDMCYTV